MNENLYGMFDKVLQSEYSIIEEGSKKTYLLVKNILMNLRTINQH
ncbi:hypothetical protein [uncultured Methanobrevibacter sp.]|nr:hypothetical protein [uncultured Methanobrevibacter sp.]